MFDRAYYLSGAYGLWRSVLTVGLGAVGGFLYYFVVKALNADIDAKYRKTKSVQYLCGIFTVAVALTIHTWVATMAWFTTYLGPRIGEEAAIAAVTAYQDGMLPAIAPMYVPMILAFGIHFVMLLAGKTRYPRWMLVFHPVTWNLLLAAVPDIAQAMTAGWSTAPENVRELGFGAGMGLPNMQRYTDDMRIESKVGEGTVVTLIVNLV